MKYIVLTTFLLICSAAAPLAGQSANQGASGMAFLKVGVDARATGMGEAYTAVTNDANASFWNPAGLMSAANSNVVFMHNEWIVDDIRAEYGALQFKRKRSSWAFQVYSFNVSGIEIRDIPAARPLDETNANYLAMGVSYARRLGEKLDAGITAKYLYEKIFVNAAKGYAVDAGFRYSELLPNIALAGVIQNIGSMEALIKEASKLPTTLRVGLHFTPQKVAGPAKLGLAIDAVKPLEENFRLHLGLEAKLWKQLLVRGGYLSGYEARQFSFGLGFHKSAFHLDYSFTPFDEDLGNSQRFSLFLAI